uniref:Uncharacterized protein n=1 Tax=Romanomermis culicivorax TaxID=13658 RepID=A0A915IFU1_ROMCU
MEQKHRPLKKISGSATASITQVSHVAVFIKAGKSYPPVGFFGQDGEFLHDKHGKLFTEVMYVTVSHSNKMIAFLIFTCPTYG